MRYKKSLFIFIIVISMIFTNSVSVFANKKTTAATTPPAPTLSYSPMAPTNGNVTVTAYYPSTAVKKQYRLGLNGAWTNYTGPFAITSNVHVYIQYQDKSGEWSALGGFNITNIDKTPPSAPLISADTVSPTNGDVNVYISYPSDANVKQFKIGSSGAWTSYSTIIAVTSNTAVFARAQDLAGNWSEESSYTVGNIDREPPLLPMFVASTEELTNEDISLSINYSDDSALKYYRIGDFGAWMEYSGALTIGSNSAVYAKAADNAGNWTNEVVYLVNNIDKTPPAEPAFTASASGLTDNPVTIAITYTEDSIIKQYKIGETCSWIDYTAPITIGSNVQVFAKSCDEAGNWSTESSYLVDNIRKTVMGYTVKNFSTDKTSYNSMVANTAALNEIATATYSVNGLGVLTGTAPADQISYANSNGIRTKLMVSNNFDSAIAKQLLESPVNRLNLKNNIISLLKANNYSGVDIDIENIPAANRDHFTTFMKEIYADLKAMGYRVSVAVQPKTFDSPNSPWNYAFDYKALAMYSDFLMIMAYDEHYPGGTHGPIASIGWVTSVIDYALTVVPKEKIVLGLAAYGYDWVGTSTKAYSVNGCYNLAAQYGAAIYMDNATKSKYFTYTVNDTVHNVWFEDAETIAYKLDLVNSRDLKGVGIWRLGLENVDYWTAIKSKLNK
ncbi:MAG: glycosyl hydrolase family 18 protein [Clostridia bacterium]|nr:glycosyl hydrolase family 18 protein [Clostridia bacterium]